MTVHLASESDHRPGYLAPPAKISGASPGYEVGG
jgi:hypothetical protein